MNKREREEKVLIEGDKTEEGRLKIEKIEKYKNDSHDNKINFIFWAILSVISFIIRILYNGSNEKDITKYIPLTSLLMIHFLFQKIKADRKKYKLEEEILNRVK